MMACLLDIEKEVEDGEESRAKRTIMKPSRLVIRIACLPSP